MCIIRFGSPRLRADEQSVGGGGVRKLSYEPGFITRGLEPLVDSARAQAMSEYRDLDYFNDLNLVNDPHPYFEQLRSIGPVVYLPKYNVVAVTGYEEGAGVLRDHQTFSLINSATCPVPPLSFKPDR
jgi:cytochrome P450